MQQLLAEFYQSALSSLERQIQNSKESVENPEGETISPNLMRPGTILGMLHSKACQLWLFLFLGCNSCILPLPG